jgi:hypothetical protein
MENDSQDLTGNLLPGIECHLSRRRLQWMLGQDGELKAALPPPPLEMPTQTYFVSRIEFLVETANITKCITATHDQRTRSPATQNRHALPQLE